MNVWYFSFAFFSAVSSWIIERTKCLDPFKLVHAFLCIVWITSVIFALNIDFFLTTASNPWLFISLKNRLPNFRLVGSLLIFTWLINFILINCWLRNKLRKGMEIKLVWGVPRSWRLWRKMLVVNFIYWITSIQPTPFSLLRFPKSDDYQITLSRNLNSGFPNFFKKRSDWQHISFLCRPVHLNFNHLIFQTDFQHVVPQSPKISDFYVNS